jgi:DNA-binding transcriptional LysR family regulator
MGIAGRSLSIFVGTVPRSTGLTENGGKPPDAHGVDMQDGSHQHSIHDADPAAGVGPEAVADTRAPGTRGTHKIDFNLLIPLHALLVEGNITRAAERTVVGQPAMSASLARLRQHFGDPLLVRSGRTMVLTPLAESLLGPVSEAVAAMHTVMDTSAAFDPAPLRRMFTIVASDYVTMVLIRPFLQEVMAEAPHVRLDIVSPRDGLVSLVRRTECDLLIAPATSVPKELLTYPNQELFSDEFVVVVADDNDSVGDSITMKELAQLPYLGVEKPIPAIREMRREGYDLVPRVAVHASHFAVTMHAVAGTQMATLVQSRLFSRLAPNAGLRAVSLDAKLPPLVQRMYWHPKYTADAAHFWLRDKLANVAMSL